MNTMLMHPCQYLKLHFHPLSAAGISRTETKPLRRVFALAAQRAKIACALISTYLVFCCFAKLVEAEILTTFYCDFCSVMSVMLVAP